MTLPALQTLYETIDVTWAPASSQTFGPWTIREGLGGGQRVSAATTDVSVSSNEIPEAEAAMRALGQTPIFMIRAGQDDLDTLLEERGYAMVDPVNLWLGSVEPLVADPLPNARAFAIWKPLEIQIDIWDWGGIGSGRIAVMDRVRSPKTSILCRTEQKASATAFVAIHEGVAMIHALEVRETMRRLGIGRLVTRTAAHWAVEQGAPYISALCTQANMAANALYSSMGLSIVGQYHYRKAPE